jgi:hypothetical protein
LVSVVEVVTHFWKAVHGNYAGHDNNLEGRELFRAARAASRAAAKTPQGQELAHQLSTQGWALLDLGLSSETIRAIQSAYEDVINDDQRTVDMGGRIPTSVRYVVDPLDRVPELRESLTPLARDVLDGYYQSQIQLKHVRMWRIEHLPEDEQAFHHYGNLWHTDQHPTSTVKMFLQITDGVNDELGALRLMGRPDTRLVMRSGFVCQGQIVGPARHLVADDARIRLFDAPAGWALFVDTTRCLHRAGVPAAGLTRGMVQMTFEPSLVPTPDDLFDSMPADENVVRGHVA